MGAHLSTEALKGAAFVVGLRALYGIWQLFHVPSIQQKRARNSAPVQRIGDDDKVTVWGLTMPKLIAIGDFWDC